MTPTPKMHPSVDEWPEFYSVAHPNDDNWTTMYVRGDMWDVLRKRLEAAEKWLKEKARHTMYCGWKDGMYDVKRGCTCGLAALAREERP